MTDAETKILERAKREPWYPDIPPKWVSNLIDLAERACRERDEARAALAPGRVLAFLGADEKAEALATALEALRSRADFWARETGRALPAECDAADEAIAAWRQP